jgi:hypothetical protein
MEAINVESILFPYQAIRPVQDVFIKDVIDALEKKQHIIVPDVPRHRILLNYGGEAENITTDNRMYSIFTRSILKAITPIGINIVENKPEFKRNFGFEVNVGLNPPVKLNWGASEK